jgi:outer membrane receptor protein involved in Fe transport
MDAVFGSRASLSVTYYNQIADDLIQQVLLQSQPVPTFQWQNIGRVTNTGIELEGTLTAGVFRLKGQYGYARSRVDQLAPNYAGDLRVGDQSLATPKHTAGASVSAALLEGTTVSGGLVYVGSWRQYDFLQEFRCFGGTGPCQSTFRDYIVEYPDFAKVNLSLTQQITSTVLGFVAVDNVTNSDSYEFFNFNPVMGRLTTVGVRLRY